MNPIERLEALAEFVRSRSPLVAVKDSNQVVQLESELRAIIGALKQRDEAVRKVAGELMEHDPGHSGCESCRDAHAELVAKAARLRAALEGEGT